MPPQQVRAVETNTEEVPQQCIPSLLTLLPHRPLYELNGLQELHDDPALFRHVLPLHARMLAQQWIRKCNGIFSLNGLTALDRLQGVRDMGLIPVLKPDPLETFCYTYIDADQDVAVTTSLPESHWVRWFWDFCGIFDTTKDKSATHTPSIRPFQQLLACYPGRHQRCRCCGWTVPIMDFENDDECSYCVQQLHTLSLSHLYQRLTVVFDTRVMSSFAWLPGLNHQVSSQRNKKRKRQELENGEEERGVETMVVQAERTTTTTTVPHVSCSLPYYSPPYCTYSRYND